MSDQPTYEQIAYNNAVLAVKNCSDGRYKTPRDVIEATAAFADKIKGDPDAIQKLVIMAMRVTRAATVDVLADRLDKIDDPSAGTGGAPSASPPSLVKDWVRRHGGDPHPTLKI